MSKPLPTGAQLRHLLQAIRDAADELEAGVLYAGPGRKKGTFTVYDLLARCAGDEPGYPPNSIRGGAGGSVVDDVDNPVPFAAGDDRVGELAVFGERGTPTEAVEGLLALLEGARARCDQAVGALKDAVPPPPPADSDGCVSCARIRGNFSPRWAGHEATERCQFCASWRPEKVAVDLPGGGHIVVKRADEDLPIEAIEYHQLRRNLTTKFWRDLAFARIARPKQKTGAR